MVGQNENELSPWLVRQLLGLIDNQYSFVFVKDQQHRYVACNSNYARFLGLESDKAIVGLMDTILNPLHADIYRTDDDKVLQGQVLDINNPGYFKDLGIVMVAGKIVPLKNEYNQNVGILGTTRLVHCLANKSFTHAIAMLNSNSIPHIVNRNFYIVNTRYGKIKLSRREVECILFLFRCLTATEIAQNLELSKRSVESYLVNIKNKLNVSHKSEIIETVVLGGLLEQL